jgi:hypothetical protein
MSSDSCDSAVFVISDKTWSGVKDSVLKSKTSFVAHLKVLLKHLELDGEEDVKAIFFLPASVTIKERHQIHKFSKKNEISGISSTQNGKRVMKVVLESEYVKQLTC